MYVVRPTNSVPVVALVVENVRQIGHISTVEAPILDSAEGNISIAMICKATALVTSRFTPAVITIMVFVEVADRGTGVQEPRRHHGGIAVKPARCVRVFGDCGRVVVDWEVGNVDRGGL